MPISELTIVVPGRNDDYGGNFKERLFRSLDHNLRLLNDVGIDCEFIFVEWNPVADKPLLSQLILDRYKESSAYVVSESLHKRYSLNPNMVFHEMTAKNVGIRRAQHSWVLSANADILLDPQLVDRLANEQLDRDKIYRAHRIDVDPSLEFEQMSAPENQLLSSEGKLPPIDFLGAAGDFILSHRDLWNVLRGMNEKARFTTRCKDWQFLLNAKKLGYKIEFLGKVYHLDHEQGFLNTSEEIRNSSTCFFGSNWDIEFELPYRNPDNWGLNDGNQDSASTKMPSYINEAVFLPTTEENVKGEFLKDALSGSSDSPNSEIAKIFHTVLYAKTRGLKVVGEFSSIFLAAAFEGLAESCKDFDGKAYQDFDWNLLGLRKPPLAKEAINYDLKIMDDGHESVILHNIHGENLAIPVPNIRKINSPNFDPLLLRRLLPFYLEIISGGHSDFAIYGAGQHTKDIIKWGIPDSLNLATIYTTSGDISNFESIMGAGIESASQAPNQPILLSSKSFESEMIETVQKLGIISQTFPLYTQFQRG